MWQVDVGHLAYSCNMAELELVAEYAPERINEVNSYGFTPLHNAVRSCQDQEAAISFLLSAGANVNQTDNSGNTPLAYAGWPGNADYAGTRESQLLIDAGGH